MINVLNINFDLEKKKLDFRSKISILKKKTRFSIKNFDLEKKNSVFDQKFWSWKKKRDFRSKISILKKQIEKRLDFQSKIHRKSFLIKILTFRFFRPKSQILRMYLKIVFFSQFNEKSKYNTKINYTEKFSAVLIYNWTSLIISIFDQNFRFFQFSTFKITFFRK